VRGEEGGGKGGEGGGVERGEVEGNRWREGGGVEVWEIKGEECVWWWEVWTGEECRGRVGVGCKSAGEREGRLRKTEA